MKKNVLFVLVLAVLLALPAAAMAQQTEFTLGGYLKLEAFWDSAALTKNINTPPRRNNDPNGTHGRFNATAQSSRFNFTIKGPTLWGAKVTGFLEVDFDGAAPLDARQSASHSYSPRMRHAFFRLNWPETELLLGQYWGFFSEFYPELIQDGPFQGHGVATQRLPQVRLTQDIGLGRGKLTLSGLIGKPTDANDSANTNYPISNAALEGQTSETPQIQAKIQYEGDLWGKAGFYGRPRGFVAQLAGAWQRSRYRSGVYAVGAVNGGTNFATGTIVQRDQQYLNNWVIQGTLFIPVIPTTTANLAGTAALTVQAYVGEGLDFIGNATGFNSQFRFQGFDGAIPLFDRRLTKTWGGYIQGNYYFSNQWFMNVAAGLGANYNVNRIGASSNPDAFLVDPVHQWWEVSSALYYRPITALKFGVQYTYTRANYYQNLTAPAGLASGGTNWGDAHSIRFGSWFFF